MGLRSAPARFRVKKLKIGLHYPKELVPPKTFVSDKKNEVFVEASAEIIGDCEDCRIDWSVHFPKQSVNEAQFINQSTIQYSHPLLEKPKGNRGRDFEAVVTAILLSKGEKTDELKYEISQDERDQLQHKTF